MSKKQVPLLGSVIIFGGFILITISTFEVTGLFYILPTMVILVCWLSFVERMYKDNDDSSSD